MKALFAFLALVAFGFALTADADPGAVTPFIEVVGPSVSGTIPKGVKSWTFSVLSGSATLMGVSVPSGFSDSDTLSLNVPLIITTGTNSSVYIRYNY